MIFLGANTGDVLYNLRSMITYMGISTATMRHPLANLLALVLIPGGLLILYRKLLRDTSSIESNLVMTLLGGYMIFWGILYLLVGAPLFIYVLRYYWIPLVLGILIFSEKTNKVRAFKEELFLGLPKISVIGLIISAGTLSTLSPTFSSMQDHIIWDFDVADRIAEYYENGTIISPVPHMTYRLINKHNIQPQNILGPIYCPTQPDKKIEWLTNNNVTLLYWLPDLEADTVFPELSEGKDTHIFQMLESLGYDKYIYKVKLD
jgi:hypothetical protein